MAVDIKRIRKGKRKLPPRVLVYGFDGIGKAQPIDAMILTPNGFSEMGSMQVGDLVIGADGNPVRVVGVFPQGKKKIFRVVMKDGAETECCEEHLWSTNTITESLAGKPYSVRTLSEIRDTFLYRMGNNNPKTPNDLPNHRVPVTDPVTFVVRGQRPLHPYLLGLLLGDGTLGATSIHFHKPEPDIMDRLASLLPEQDTVTRFEDGTGLRIRRKILTAPRVASETFMALSTLGLIGLSSLEKFIPDPYLFSSIEDRTELLRGIADTDGHVIRSGQRIEISTSSPRLKDGIIFLVRSLGGVITLREKIPTYSYNGEKRIGAKSWRMLAAFPRGLCPVSSEKHLAKWRIDQTPHYQSIVEIEEVGEKECQCIKVDAPDGLYVTDDFIVTHNTSFAAGAPRPFIIDANKGSSKFDVEAVEPTSWEDAMSWIDAVADGTVKCDTLVLDSLTDLEAMSHVKLFPNDTVTGYKGGYGKGDDVVAGEWRLVQAKLERIWLSGKSIVLVAHARVRKFEDPTGPGYERFEVSSRPGLAGQLRMWSDYVLFCREDVGVAPGGGKAVTTGTRWMYTRRTPAYDAKARASLMFPEKILLSWHEFQLALDLDNAGNRSGVEASISEMLSEIGDTELDTKVRSYIKEFPSGLMEAYNSVSARLEEARKSKAAPQEQTAAQ